MIGFIQKLLRSQPQPKIEIEQSSATPTTPSRNGGAFFLEADEAKTLGDLEYMRSAKSIRRTFPKAKLGKENESIRSISAMEMATPSITPIQPPISVQPASVPTNGKKPVESVQIGETVTDRRAADPGMDLFRNMARQIKKG